MGARVFGWEERILIGRDEFAARKRLLESRGLSVPDREDIVLGLFENDSLVATGSLVGSVLEGIAVTDACEGEGAAAAIVSSLIRRAVEAGKKQLFLYTKTHEARRFEAMGFSLIASTGGQGVALLEWGMEGIGPWLEALRNRTAGSLWAPPRWSSTAIPSPSAIEASSNTPRPDLPGSMSLWSRRTGLSFRSG